MYLFLVPILYRVREHLFKYMNHRSLHKHNGASNVDIKLDIAWTLPYAPTATPQGQASLLVLSCRKAGFVYSN